MRRRACASQLFGTNLGYIVGVKFLGATAAAIWQSSLPVFTTLIALMVGYEQLSILKVVGVSTAFAGCAFLTLFEPPPAVPGHSNASDAGSGAMDASASAQVTGNLIFLLQVVACAAFFVAEKPLLTRWTPLATLAYSYAIASFLMLAAGIVINSTPQLLDVVCPDCNGIGWAVPAQAWLAIAYWVLLCSVGGYFLLTWGNLYVDASMVGVYFTVQPIAAVAAAVCVIALTPAPHYGMTGPGWQDLGAIGIFAGVSLLIWDARSASSGMVSSTVEPLTSPEALSRASIGMTGQSPSTSPLPRRTRINASTSHDSILLAMRLATSARAGDIRPGASAEDLPRYRPLGSPLPSTANPLV